MSRTRNTRNSKTTSPRHKARGGTLLGMFIGLILGVVVAAGVVLYMNKAPVPFVNKVQPAVAPADSGQAPLALPGKPGDPVPEKRFQFYDILPGKAEAVPEKEETASAATSTTPEQAKTPETTAQEKPTSPVYLQAGSFSNAQDADKMKANLAMMGQESFVQQVMLKDKTYYRLRLGPYSKPEKAEKARAELASVGIETTLINKE